MTKIHDHIRALRILQNFSQEHLAESLGISQSAYGKLERGETNLTWNKLLQVIDVLETSLWDIVYFNSEEKFRMIPGESGLMTNTSLGECLHTIRLQKEQIQHFESVVKLMEIQIADKNEIIALLQKQP